MKDCHHGFRTVSISCNVGSFRRVFVPSYLVRTGSEHFPQNGHDECLLACSRRPIQQQMRTISATCLPFQKCVTRASALEYYYYCLQRAERDEAANTLHANTVVARRKCSNGLPAAEVAVLCLCGWLHPKVSAVCACPPTASRNLMRRNATLAGYTTFSK